MDDDHNKVGRGPSLAAVVLFVRDLPASSAFYQELLRMRETVESVGACLLVNESGFEIYLRDVGTRAARASGGVGMARVIWAADGAAELERCYRVLRTRCTQVERSSTDDGITVLEARDPNGIPVTISFPGPTELARQHIMRHVYQ